MPPVLGGGNALKAKRISDPGGGNGTITDVLKPKVFSGDGSADSLQHLVTEKVRLRRHRRARGKRDDLAAWVKQEK